MDGSMPLVSIGNFIPSPLMIGYFWGFMATLDTPLDLKRCDPHV
jgi:hypothetical protein